MLMFDFGSIIVDKALCLWVVDVGRRITLMLEGVPKTSGAAVVAETAVAVPETSDEVTGWVRPAAPEVVADILCRLWGGLAASDLAMFIGGLRQVVL